MGFNICTVWLPHTRKQFSYHTYESENKREGGKQTGRHVTFGRCVSLDRTEKFVRNRRLVCLEVRDEKKGQVCTTLQLVEKLKESMMNGRETNGNTRHEWQLTEPDIKYRSFSHTHRRQKCKWNREELYAYLSVTCLFSKSNVAPSNKSRIPSVSLACAQ